jgi:hypothetical protein
MDGEHSESRMATVPADALQREESWDPALFVSGRLRLSGASVGVVLSARATIIQEGVRTLRALGEDANPIYYRAGSISLFELVPSADQWSSAPVKPELQAVVTGDVVVKRIAPVVAAVVPPGLPLFPVDAAYFVIRGLAEPTAWWLAFCLNYPALADYLISKSGRGVLSRISLNVLREWEVPAMPDDFAPLTRRLGELLSARAFLAGRFADLRAAVEVAVAEQMATTAYEDTEQRFAQPSWTCFFPAVLAESSWLPTHVASISRSAALRQDRDWRPLSSFLLPAPPSRNRLSKLETPIPVLRLSDVGEVPLVPESVKPSDKAQANRVFSEPLHADDVILSTLGSNPRVAFMVSKPQVPVHAVDHWERLRFRAHAAAFALILQTGAVTRQLRSFASGSVQQFVRPEDIQRLFLPVLPEETLTQWDRSFRSLARAWQENEAAWHSALRDGWQSFARAFQLSPSEVFPHES